MRTTCVKELHPKDADIKHMGGEPNINDRLMLENRKLAMIKAFAWYGYYYSNKEAKSFIQSWLAVNDLESLAKQISEVPDDKIILAYGWLARLSLVGLELTQEERFRLLAMVNGVIAMAEKNREIKVKTSSPNKVDIHQLMRDRAHDAAGELEGLYDDYLITDIRAGEKPAVRQILVERNILGQHISIIKRAWIDRVKELEEVLSDKEEQLSEGYGYLSRTQVKNLISFNQMVIAELDSYAQNKKAKRNIRRKKIVPVEKLVNKIKYLKKFAELDLQSISPVRIVGASELWLYNTKNRKLQYYVADDYAKVFTVKGHSILGFDTSKSVQKTLRNPGVIINTLLNAGKPVARKLFADIKTTPTLVNGRINENLIILRAS